MKIYFIILVIGLIWWLVTHIFSDEKSWGKKYEFTNTFMIIYLVCQLVIGPIVGMYIVPDFIMRNPSEGLYFLYLFKVGLIMGIIFGFFGGLMALNKQK